MEFNNTIFGYVQQLRMERAKQQLLAGKSIKEVAYEIGYEHPHHFSTAFRKWYHIPPSRLKQDLDGRNGEDDLRAKANGRYTSCTGRSPLVFSRRATGGLLRSIRGVMGPGGYVLLGLPPGEVQ